MDRHEERFVKSAKRVLSASKEENGKKQKVVAIPPNYEAVKKRAEEVIAKIRFHHRPEFGCGGQMRPVEEVVGVHHKSAAKAGHVLRLDAHGREINEHGNVIINMPKLNSLSTLKVNINKQKREALEKLKPDLDVGSNSNPHYDERLRIDNAKVLRRPKRMSFQFVEEGRCEKQAKIIRINNQYGEARAKELKMKQAQLKKAKAEPNINPNWIPVSERVLTTKEKIKDDPIPHVEWWDALLLPYGDIFKGGVAEDGLMVDRIITSYVEHPLPIEPYGEPAPPPPQTLMLTKKEKKKLRTQRRQAIEKDKQEMIRQGLLEPPKPKIKLGNLMNVLGSVATQDPTRVEMEIRRAATEREQAHVDRNIASKLTPSEVHEKKMKKLFGHHPNTLEIITKVSVYKINDLSHQQTHRKVDVNAEENRLTGCAVITDDISLVVVEGGTKSIQRFQQLMLERINWAAAVATSEKENKDDDDEDKPDNKCVLVWQGSVARPSFNSFFIQDCRTEAAARKYFSDAGVGHYWEILTS